MIRRFTSSIFALAVIVLVTIWISRLIDYGHDYRLWIAAFGGALFYRPLRLWFNEYREG